MKGSGRKTVALFGKVILCLYLFVVLASYTPAAEIKHSSTSIKAKYRQALKNEEVRRKAYEEALKKHLTSKSSQVRVSSGTAAREKQQKQLQSSKLYQFMERYKPSTGSKQTGRFVMLGSFVFLGFAMLLHFTRKRTRDGQNFYSPYCEIKKVEYNPMELFDTRKFIDSNCILLGVNRKMEAQLTTFDSFRENCLILAPHGQGKTVLFMNIIFQFMMRKFPVVMMDPSGDKKFVNAILNAAYVLGARMPRIINLTDPKCPSVGFLRPLPNDDGLTVAGRILATFKMSLEDAKDDRHYLIQKARYLKHACILLFEFFTKVVRDSSGKISRIIREGFLWEDLHKFMQNRSFRETVLAEYKKHAMWGVPGTDGKEIDWWRNFEEDEKLFNDATKDAMGLIEQFVILPQVNRIFNTRNPEVDIFNSSEKGEVVFFNIPADTYQFDYKPLGRMIVAYMAALMAYRNSVDEKEWSPMLFGIDEYIDFQTPVCDALLSKNRKSGISMMIAFQNLGQLERTGTHNTENLATQLIYGCRTILVGHQRLHKEAERWSQKSLKLRIKEVTNRFGFGILYHPPEGTLEREIEVHSFHSNFFKKLKPGQVFGDFVDAHDQYTQDLIYTPKLPFIDVQGPLTTPPEAT